MDTRSIFLLHECVIIPHGWASCKQRRISSHICSLQIEYPKVSHSHDNYNLSEIQTNWHQEM